MHQLQLDPPADVVADYSTDLPPTASSVPKARAITRRQLAVWGAATHSDTAELLVTELMTNALRHAPASRIRLTLSSRQGSLLCEVRDDCSAHPVVSQAHGQDESGRGLFLVQQLSDRWGSRPSGTGKTVWFEIHS